MGGFPIESNKLKGPDEEGSITLVYLCLVMSTTEILAGFVCSIEIGPPFKLPKLCKPDKVPQDISERNWEGGFARSFFSISVPPSEFSGKVFWGISSGFSGL